jgi:hypothetical protein
MVTISMSLTELAIEGKEPDSFQSRQILGDDARGARSSRRFFGNTDVRRVRDDLGIADANEEGAGMLMLQTRQSLSITALSLSTQAAQSVLRLF